MKNKLKILIILNLFNLSYVLAAEGSLPSQKDGSDKNGSISIPGVLQSNIFQKVVFKGQPGFVATAAIVNIENQDPRLVITHSKYSQKQQNIVINNEHLGLNVGGMAGTESKISLSKDGSLLITNQNDAIGRDRWKKTVTIKFYNGEYVISRFQSTSNDTLKADSEISCEYDLLTGKGIVGGKNVKAAPQHITLKNLKESQKFTLCDQW